MRETDPRRSPSGEPDRVQREDLPSSGRTAVVAKPLPSVAELGWTPEEAAETRARLRLFEEDWDAAGMDAYDDL